MNRRGFFKTLAVATAGFAILPPATTYQRVWKAVAVPKINPAWENAPYEVSFIVNPLTAAALRDAPFEAAGLIFSPRRYMGEWKVIECGSPCENG